MKLRDLYLRAKNKFKRMFSLIKRRKIFLREDGQQGNCTDNQIDTHTSTPIKSIRSPDESVNHDPTVPGEEVKRRRSRTGLFAIVSTETVERRRRSLVEPRSKRKSKVFSIAAITEGVAQLRKEIQGIERKPSDSVDAQEPRRREKTMVDRIDDITLQFGSLLHVTLNQLNREKTSGPKIIYTHRKKHGFTSNRTQLVKEVVEEFQKQKTEFLSST